MGAIASKMEVADKMLEEEKVSMMSNAENLDFI